MSSKTKTTATKEVATPALLPKLRFPQFRAAKGWNLVTLQEASVPVAERVGQRKLTPVSISAGIGFVPQSEKFGRDISGNQYQLYTLVRDGDFVFNKGNSLKFPQGCIYLLQGWGQVAAPNVFICFRLKDGYSNGFYQQCFEQNQHGRELKRHITSGARSNGLLNISKETFFGVEIPTPSLPEQQKIADCLTSLDELIAAEAHKLDTLKTHKKGLMQQLFPREGETQPRLRFPEFQNAGEWEVRRLGELGKVCMCKRVMKHETSGIGEIPFYKIGTFGKKADASISRKLFEDFKSKYSYPKKGDILISAAGTIGRTVVFDGQDAYFQDSNIVWIANSEKLVSNAFLFYCYSNVKWTTDDNTIPRLYNENLRNIQILSPAPPEQQRIADCLSSLDDLITAQTQKLDTLKVHKKGLMQQLFPSPEELTP